MKTPFIAAVVCLFLTSCHSKKEVKVQKDPPPIVDVIVAQPKTVSNTIEANGSVVANEYVELHPEIGGRIVYLNVPEGSVVQQGTIIARINDADLQAQVAKSKVQLDLAQQTEKRLSTLLAVNGVNQSDYDTALNQVNSLKADIVYTQTLIDKTVLKAPFTGVIGLRQVSNGAFVTTANLIATMQQLDKLKVDFTIPEQFGVNIQKGSTVEVQMNATKNIKCKAVVIAKEPQINQTTRNLIVRAMLGQCQSSPGAFVKVNISTGTDKNSILIPTNSIIPDDRNKKVVVVHKGKAEMVNVITGLRKADFVEITSGINTGDSVVVDGVLFAKPGKPVKVRSVKHFDN